MYKYVKDKDNGNSGINVYEENTIFWSKTGEPEPHVWPLDPGPLENNQEPETLPTKNTGAGK